MLSVRMHCGSLLGFCLLSSLDLLSSHLSAILCMSIAVSWVYVFVDFLCFLDAYL